LWIDKTGQPVITTTANGERNARRWGWAPARAIREGMLRRALDAYRAEMERAKRPTGMGASIALVAGAALATSVEAAITPEVDR
jgi:hypothetical protein